MGALTIKNYTFETRNWELQRLVIPNLFNVVPTHLILFVKNRIVKRILPYERNSIISNKIRFSWNVFNSFLKQENDLPFFSFQLNSFLLIRFLSVFFLLPFIARLLSMTVYKSSLMTFLSPFLDNQIIYKLHAFDEILISNEIRKFDVSLDEDNFYLLSEDLMISSPDLYFFIKREMFLYSEEESGIDDDDVLIEKGLSCIKFNKNPKHDQILFVWNKLKLFFFMFFNPSKIYSLSTINNRYLPYVTTEKDYCLGYKTLDLETTILNYSGCIV